MMVMCRKCDVAWSDHASDHCWMCGSWRSSYYPRLSDTRGVYHVSMHTVEWGKEQEDA